MQRAVVVAVNERRQMAALDCGGGGFCALEWQTGRCLLRGQVLEGEFSVVGPTRLARAGSSQLFLAYLHLTGLTYDEAVTYCL